MAEETNELLQKILDAQRELLAISKQEVEQTANFRALVLRDQKVAVRRGVSFAIIIITLIAALVVAVETSKPAQQPPLVKQPSLEDYLPHSIKINPEAIPPGNEPTQQNE